MVFDRRGKEKKRKEELRVIVNKNRKYFMVGRHSMIEGMQHFVTEITISINFLENKKCFPPALPFSVILERPRYADT
jgi:hypothetical protein